MTFPITPPPELAAKWVGEIYGDPAIPLHPITLCLVDRAAQWGADQEIEALLSWLRIKHFDKLANELLAARRPSLKEQALSELDALEDMGACNSKTIRRALEQLND